MLNYNYPSFYTYEIDKKTEKLVEEWFERAWKLPRNSQLQLAGTDENASFFVSLDLPGVKKEDVKITLVENTLIITAIRKDEKSTYTYPVIDRYDVDKTVAKFELNVLTVTIPLKQQALTREIKIE
jgi:HSP20 family molecular chaperone IbpA